MISFYNYYKTKGHVFGECMSSPNTDLMYINIPKNASSWTKLNCTDWQWEFFNYHTDNLYHKHSLIVLRDPVERWLSGIAEYFFLYHKNLDFAHVSRPFLDLIFDRVAFDDHTEKQILFIEKLNLNNSTFFWCNSDYKKNFGAFLNLRSLPNKNHNLQHVTKDSQDRQRIKTFFELVLDQNPGYLEKIKWYFDDDYQLIDQVDFFNE